MINYLNPCPAYAMPYIVREGDTLNSVADRYGISLKALIDLNPDLRQRSLVAGMQICVPKVNVRPSCPNGSYYVIKEGDSFYKIAQKYGISLNRLMRANPASNPYNLRVGEEICIPEEPVNCPFGTIYTIEAGRTLSDILVNYNLSLNELRNANPDLDPTDITSGMKLCIPPSRPSTRRCPTSRTYTVKAGDTLAKIAEAYQVTTTDMLIVNPDLRPLAFGEEGTVVCIPEGIMPL